jgi:hypothetical protein
MFKTNVGGIDRIVRILAGLALLGLTLDRRHRRLGLDRPRAAGHRSDGQLPGLPPDRPRHLPDEVAQLSCRV